MIKTAIRTVQHYIVTLYKVKSKKNPLDCRLQPGHNAWPCVFLCSVEHLSKYVELIILFRFNILDDILILFESFP